VSPWFPLIVLLLGNAAYLFIRANELAKVANRYPLGHFLLLACNVIAALAVAVVVTAS
jgi:hypothetical protein